MISMTCENWPRLEGADIPIYVQIYDIIFQMIQDGILHEGDCLPGENLLAAHWNVSRTTVRIAIRKLEEDGYLYKMQGKRTTVASRTSRFDYGLQWLFNPCLKSCISPVSRIALESNLQQCGIYVAEKLDLNAFSTVMVTVNANYFVDQNLVATSVLMFHNHFLEQRNLSLQDEAALREVLTQGIYRQAIRARCELTSVTREADASEMPDGENALIIEEVLIGADDTPMAYCKYRMSANWYRFAFDRKPI